LTGATSRWARQFNCSTSRYVENDANAAALAEEQLRDASEGDNLLFVLLDSGVGAGLLVDRQLYRGGAGRVGESGHIRLPATDGSTGAGV
jgi:predicted NBD/HSP70 family sugar kinase